MPSSASSDEPRRLGNNAALRPSATPASIFREGNLGGLSCRWRLSSEAIRSVRNSLTMLSTSNCVFLRRRSRVLLVFATMMLIPVR